VWTAARLDGDLCEMTVERVSAAGTTQEHGCASDGVDSGIDEDGGVARSDMWAVARDTR
jgi:hypothetical protein